MKKIYLSLIGLSLAATVSAQTILNEDFETGNTGSALTPVAAGAGWTTIDGYKGTNPRYNWHNYYANYNEENTNSTISGFCCAAVECPITGGSGDGDGPREEILLSPELNLNDTYQLQFTFRVSPMNAYDNSRYDLQVRVVENGNVNAAENVFSIQSEQMLRASGITTFPIGNWDPYTAKVDLSDWKGKKIKLAFVYKMLRENANVLWLDDISVKKFTPPTGPQPSVSIDRYNFGDVYIGETKYSDPVTFTNIGKDGLKVTGLDLPQGVGVTFEPASVNLDTYQTFDFQLSYSPTMTSPASGNVVIKTNGGNVTIPFSATKMLVPDGYTLETFNDYFPPAGWSNNGWSWSTRPIEGTHSALGSGDFSATSLRSPRIDLTDGGKVTFSYYNNYDGETAPEYDIELQVSYNGGDSWVKKWQSDWQNGLNKHLTATVDLGYGDDQCYVRWYYPAVETSDEGAAEHSQFTLDRVLLPNVVGAGGVPQRATIISPANQATDVYPKDVVLKWGPAQFADGYKVYVGTNNEANDLVNGVDVGPALTYTIPACQYATTYRWKIVGYNSVGDASSVSTWRFTTQADASVAEYPYVQDFLTEELPTGWNSTPSANYNRTWYVNSIHKYKANGNEYGVLASNWLDEGDSNSVTSQEFLLPDDKPMYISFIWGDEHPADLMVDPSGSHSKVNVEPNNGISYTTFDIYADGKWTTLSQISEEKADKKYWCNEKFDLSAYKGKKVQFRWAHYSLHPSQDQGGSLTHIVLDENKDDQAEFNLTSWNAGKVNYNKATTSGDAYNLINTGNRDLKVKSVTFNTPNFESTLKVGDVVARGATMPLTLQFNAGETDDKVTDKMTVEFESGYSITMDLSGEALANGIYYYSFEPNPLDYVWDEDFTMIDADNGVGYHFSSYWVHYSKDSQKSAFSAESDSKENGMYGMMAPVSGLWALVASSPQTGSADNWIISKAVTPTDKAKFDFYARNWESLQSVLPDPKHRVTVLVSTVIDNPKTSDFTPVMRETEMPFLDAYEWNHYEVDLSAYANIPIKIALRHTTVGASNLAFFDDFTISGVDGYVESIIDVDTDLSADATVEVYNISGIKVAQGKGMQVLDTLGHGFYVVRISDGTSVKAYRIAR